ncbi:MAG: hypothetical protein R3E79_22625 [Caldilineaceae bacterium]
MYKTKQRRWLSFLSFALILSLLLAACGPRPELPEAAPQEAAAPAEEAAAPAEEAAPAECCDRKCRR